MKKEGAGDKSLAGFLKGVNVEVFDAKMLYMAENKRTLSAV